MNPVSVFLEQRQQPVPDRKTCFFFGWRDRGITARSKILSAMNARAGLRRLAHDVSGFDRIVLCGPICMGRFISPLKGFLHTYLNSIKALYFVSCCGSSDDSKDDKFGYATVFSKVKEAAGDACIDCEAFPIPLLLSDGSKEDGQADLQTRLCNENFSGEIRERFEYFV